MSIHLTEETIQRYRRRALSARELLEADDHLAACEPCRHRLLAPELLTAGARAARGELDLAAAEPFHPDYEHLAGYVDGALNAIDREILEAHLADCGGCATETRELRAFKALMSTHAGKRHAPTAAPSLTERFRSVFSLPAVRLPLQAAAAAGAAAAAVFALSVQPLQERASSLRRENTSLAQQASAARRLEGDLARSREAAGQAENERARLAEANRRLQARLKPAAGPLPTPSPAPGPQVAAAPAAPTPQEGIPAAVAGLVGRQGRLMGAGGEGVPFALRGPLGTVVREPRPTLRWDALPGAGRYRVTLAREGGDDVIESPDLTATEWKVTPPLKPGAAYTWQVTAQQGEKEVTSPVPPAPEAKFRVLDGAAARGLAQGTAQAHLTVGIAYAKAGLLEDAERELQLALQADPKSGAARKQLAALRKWRAPAR